MKTPDKISELENGTLTSGDNLSYWFSSAIKPLAFEKLNQNVITDILVIGGGIAGLTTAYCLAKEGRKVILVEDGFIGSGETGRTTAHITNILDDHYFELEKMFDTHTAQLVANSHMAAVKWIAKTVKDHKIDCHFKRVDGYLFLDPSDTVETLEKEYEATKRAGLTSEMLNSVPSIVGLDDKRCLKFSDQAQFHILLYLKGLADSFIKLGGKIYTQTRAQNITTEGAVANGFKVKANHIVVATNTPVNDWVKMHTKQWPYRTYVVAAKIPKGKLPYALWWDTGNQDSKWIVNPYHYVRLEEFDHQYDLLIAGGEDHRTGQADDEDIKEEDRYANLEKWTKEHFPAIGAIEFKWSGQIMEPIDSLAYIGKNPDEENIYIITGLSGNGMTYGTLGGIIITDIITGKENPWIEIYSPSRITLKATGYYLHEVGNMALQFIDWLTPEHIKEISDLKLGQGGIISSGLKKIAVYRDEQNNLNTFSAVCPHLGGILQWNADEKSFDCPMHGSRFTNEGKVINGPAVSDLKKIIDKEHNV